MQMFESSPSLWLGLRSWAPPSLRRGLWLGFCRVFAESSAQVVARVLRILRNSFKASRFGHSELFNTNKAEMATPRKPSDLIRSLTPARHSSSVRRRNEDMNSDTMQMFESSSSLWLGLRSWVPSSLRRFFGAGLGLGSAESSQILRRRLWLGFCGFFGTPLRSAVLVIRNFSIRTRRRWRR